MFLRSYFEAAFVPGKEGVKLLNFFGMPINKIYVGNYGASEDIYFDQKPITSRNKEFLFVGQLIKRKGIDILLEAFRQYQTRGGTWKLRVIGDGPYYEQCSGDGIIRDGFVQPNQVCSAMNDARVFALVSRDEHWGTVVCEAAACGMGLITSRSVGSSCDLVRNGINGIELATLEISELVKAFFYFEKLDHDLLTNASKVSKGIAQGYNSLAYYASFRKMILDLTGQ
jgi:glycosyltransferase involved in cell wall biosynthesis